MKLLRALFDQMIEHVKSCLPEEGCGILGGHGEEAILVVPVENELHSPVKFRMGAGQQLEALLALERDGLDLVGIWHSHPNGPSRLSATDLAEAYYPDTVLLVWSPNERQAQGWQVCAFRILNGQVIEEEILVT
jgi:proteasome lid subunit RPN8/RPN11